MPSGAGDPSARFLLDFGAGTPVPVPAAGAEHSMRAYLESPIREAAQVYVNGQLAGAVWRPPYRVEITPYLKPGRNAVRIVVANTAINALAGQAEPDYRLLWDRYGMLFVPQDMNNLHPLPSGLLGPVTLVVSKPVVPGSD